VEVLAFGVLVFSQRPIVLAEDEVGRQLRGVVVLEAVVL